MEVVYHQAAAVGVGQSMYDIKRYMDVNTIGTSVVLEAMIARRGAVQEVVVASSMSIYGEGRYKTERREESRRSSGLSSQFPEGDMGTEETGTGEELFNSAADR